MDRQLRSPMLKTPLLQPDTLASSPWQRQIYGKCQILDNCLSFRHESEGLSQYDSFCTLAARICLI